VISTRNEHHLAGSAEENHSQVETGAALHDGTAEFANSRPLMGMRGSNRFLRGDNGIKHFSLVCRGQRFHPLAEAGS